MITADSKAAPQAWVDAYHDKHLFPSVAPLPIKSGALQGAVVIDNALHHRFESLHIVYDGINGQLPNLDLINTAVSIASGQMGIGVSLQRMWKHNDSYRERLQTMLRGMISQGLGHASGPHSSFIPYHIDAITLQAVGEGWQDEMAMGRCVESIFRSLNNLLEHFHQSFFFYLLMQANRFVSIGTYLPSAILVAISFTIMAIALWIQSGRSPPPKIASIMGKTSEPETEIVEKNGLRAVIPKQDSTVAERHLFFPISLVVSLHFFGVIPLYIFNNTPRAVSLSSPPHLTYPYLTSSALLPHSEPPRSPSNFHSHQPSPPHRPRLRHLPASPSPTVPPPPHAMHLPPPSRHLPSHPRHPQLLPRLPHRPPLLPPHLPRPFRRPRRPCTHAEIPCQRSPAISIPPALAFAVCARSDIHVGDLLAEAAFGWRVSGLWTPMVVWCIWWPAWLSGAVVVNPLFKLATGLQQEGGGRMHLRSPK